MSIATRPTTGTAWDILLDQSSASPATTAVTARAAYQAAVHGRAVLVDVRATRHPDRPWVPGGLVGSGVETALAHLADGADRPVLLLDDDGAPGGTAAALAASDTRLVAVAGGVRAWRTDGLPLVRLAIAPPAA